MYPPHLSARLFALLLTLSSSIPIVWAAQSELYSLQVGKPIERTLSKDEKHSYTLTLAAGQFANVVVDQRGADVEVAAYGPDSAKIVQVDSPNDNYGPESLSFLAETAGTYRVEVRALWARNATGPYEVRLVQLRNATPEDRNRATAQKLSMEAKALRRNNDAESYKQALEKYLEALNLWRSTNDKLMQAFMLHEIGWIYGDIGQYQKALDHYAQAAALYKSFRDPRGEANILSNTAWVYGELGDDQKALEMYLLADDLFRSTGVIDSTSLSNIGASLIKLGQYERALDYHLRALEMRRAVNDRPRIGLSLTSVGSCYHLLDDKPKALEYFTEALKLIPEVKDDYYTAKALNNIGTVYRKMGDFPKALDFLNQALTLRLKVGDPRGTAETLSQLARLERDRGNLTVARKLIEETLARVEITRYKVSSPRLRSMYFASVQQHRDFYVDLLIRLHKQNPSEGLDRAAFNANETGRARSLLESLREANTEIRHGVDTSLLEREQSLGKSIASKAASQMRLLNGPHTDEQAAAAAKEINSLTTEYEQVQAQIRATSPEYASLVQPVPLGLDEIQKRVLDPDTVLLEYALGEAKSFVWAVTPDSMKLYELPKRSEIQPLARRVYELLIARNQNVSKETLQQRRRRIDVSDSEYPKAAADLSRMVLGPVAAELKNKRLLIVGDGVLQFVPFAGLPDPGASDSRALIVDHEIVTAPSASVVASLRQENGNRSVPTKTVAVLADPVFSNNDPRVARTANAHANAWSTESDLSNLRRLRFSRQEAEEIARFAPDGSKLEAVDFAANRKLATSAELGQYRIVHFATHGLINNEHPELSGVVLSLVDEKGQPQNGFLRLYDLYNLKLSAELVVLSACQTALGKEIKGEGLVGLTRGFMYAGAPRVIASLWQIDDRASAEFMKRFYQGLLGEKLRPAAALKAAQVSMQKDKRWQNPHYWAAFSLQGEWR